MLEFTIMKAKYLALDCEMGGIGLETSLLTVCIDKLDKDLKKIDRLYLKLKPDNGLYTVTGKGMEINGINLGAHDADPQTLTYKKAATSIYQYLDSEGRRKTEDKYLIIGHQVKGDVNHICDKTISNNSWQEYCSYRLLDTSVIANFFIQNDLITLSEEFGNSGSLGNLAKHFGVGEQPKAGHDAGDDVDLTVAVYKKLCTVLKLSIV